MESRKRLFSLIVLLILGPIILSGCTSSGNVASPLSTNAVTTGAAGASVSATETEAEPTPTPIINIKPEDLNSEQAWTAYLLSGNETVRQEAMKSLLEKARSSEVIVMVAAYALLDTAKNTSDGDYHQAIVGCLVELAKLDAARVIHAMCYRYPMDGIIDNVLKAIGEGTCVESLLSLRTADPRIQQAVFGMLGLVGGSRAMEVIYGVLKDTGASANDRSYAAVALGMIGKNDPSRSKAVEGDLIAVMRNRANNAQLRNAAAKALGEIGSNAAADAVHLLLKDKTFDRNAVFEILGQFKGKHVTGLLVKDLKSKDWQIRYAAAQALGNIGDDSAAAALIALFSDQEVIVPPVAAEALGKIRGDRVYTLLLKALKNKNSTVRRYAALALGKGGYRKAVVTLAGALKDKESWVRSAAAEALGDIGDGRAASPLIAASKKNLIDNNEAVRALAKLKGDAVVDVLIAALRDKQVGVRDVAARALGGIQSPRSVDALLVALKDKRIRDDVIMALCKIKSPQSVEGLIGVVRAKDTDKLIYVIEALGEIGDKRAVEPLIELMKSEDITQYGSFGYTVVEALGKLGDPRAVEPLLPLLKSADIGMLYRVIEALKSLKDPRAAGPLCKLLSHAEYRVVTEATQALEAIEPSALIAPLTAALDDNNGWARFRAALLLDKYDEKGSAGRFDAAYEAGDAAIVAGAYQYFIKLGREGSEALLIQGLNQYGTEEVGEAFLNCGNAKLDEAARQWAQNHNYTILPSSGASSLVWGGSRP